LTTGQPHGCQRKTDTAIGHTHLSQVKDIGSGDNQVIARQKKITKFFIFSFFNNK